MIMPEQQPLDIISDTMALTSFNNTKNIILMAGEIVGRFDEQAFKLAVRGTAVEFPALASVLNQTRNGSRFHLFREHHPELEIPVFTNDIGHLPNARPDFHSLVLHLTPRLDRNWDLWKEPPIEIHVLRSSREHFILAFMIHHAVADAAMALRIITEILVRCHNLVTGEQPTCLSMPHVFSTSRKRSQANPGKFRWKDFLSQLRRDLAYRKQRPVQPLGTGNKGDLREWHVKRVLSLHDSSAVLDHFSNGEAHFVDNLVACANMALDKWNQVRNVPPGLITTAVTVNMRERFGGEEEKNYSSVIFFRSTAEERGDHATFARLLAEARRKQMSTRVDLSVRKSISRAARFFSLFPLWIRRRIAHSFMQHQRYSFAVGFLGVVWPELKEQAFGEDSCLVRLGDSDIVDVHGTGYKLAGNASLNLYAYIYRRRLHLVLASPAAVLTEQECENFMEVLVSGIAHAVHSPQRHAGRIPSAA